MQNIVYREYLPPLGVPSPLAGADPGSHTSYDHSVDPSITNEFATAAFRFGHSMVQGTIRMEGEEGTRRQEQKLWEYLL